MFIFVEKLRFLRPILISPKFKALFSRFKADEVFTLLDVGCGNHSPSITKRYFRNCRYFGLDKEIYNNDEDDIKLMEKFYLLDLDHLDLSILPDDFFDAIVMNHVIEHLRNGIEVLAGMVSKLKKDGLIYIEFPSQRSLYLPSMPGTLRFDDDKSHVKFYSFDDIVSTVRKQGLKILKAGPRRDMFKVIFTPFTYIYLKYIKKTEYAVAFWDILGFADFVMAKK